MTGFSLADGWHDRLDRFAADYHDADKYGDRRREIRSEFPRRIGEGNGRHVFRLPDDAYEGGQYDSYAVKIAVPHDHDGVTGCAQNRREARVWEREMPAEFVPVVATTEDGLWLVMPEGDGRPSTGAESYREWTRRVRDLYAGLFDLSDLQPKNVVELAGDYRLCDYGFNR